MLVYGLFKVFSISGRYHDTNTCRFQNGGVYHFCGLKSEYSSLENPHSCIMSRLIIRNLPKNIKEDRVRSIFVAKGELTDVKLCYTKDGKFRRFGFIGYKTEDQAQAALQHFNKSFIDTSKITVDIAKNLGDESLPRPWSKYSQGSSANKRLEEKREKKIQKRLAGDLQSKDKDDVGKEKSNLLKEKNKKKKIKILDELEHDDEFQDFLSVHKLGSSKQTRSKVNSEGGDIELKESQESERKTQVEFDGSDESENEDEVYDASGTADMVFAILG